MIEAKVGTAQLSVEQVECYLDLARQMNLDALITISNQFATLPTHHPIAVNRQKLRQVELYHFSWLAILTKARLLSDDKKVDDPEQAFILKELIRYLSHESSGVCQMTRLGPEWKEISTRIQTGTPIAKGDAAAASVVSQWHQLTRYLALELSAAVGKQVDVWLSRAHSKDPVQRLAEELVSFAANSALNVEMEVPNAASRLYMEADFLRRSLRFSVSLNTPQDKTRPTAAVNWATRQLAALAESPDTLIRARWPRRAVDTVARLSDAIRDPKLVAPDDKRELPIAFEIQRVVDLAGRFKGSNTFIEDARRELPRFYKEVVQNVVNWVPRAPKFKEDAMTKADIAIADKAAVAVAPVAVLDGLGELTAATLDPDREP